MKIDEVKKELSRFLEERQEPTLYKDTLKIDLHCHDRNSDNPSERLGRLLGIPETWLKTEDLLDCLGKNNVTATTITNHNNARSCWDLIDKGFDILPGAEFTCKVPNTSLSIHVLTYGFTPVQEVKLNKLRGNLYNFLGYCREMDILTVWAHPLFFNHTRFSAKTVRDLEHVATLFSHFEIINGQRSSHQNIVTARWLETFTEEKINRIAGEYNVNINEFCYSPYNHHFVGGSDDHMGLFAGSTGTYVHVNGLKERLKVESRADLVLQGLKNGSVSPYGTYTDEGKMTISFLELFYMIVKNMEDPGLIRMILHQGKKSEKLAALMINNGIEELRRHKFTLQFLNTFHNALHGRNQNSWKQAFVKKSTKPLINEIRNISDSKSLGTSGFISDTMDSLYTIFSHLNSQAVSRGADTIKEMGLDAGFKETSVKLQPLLEKFELPATFRSYTDSEDVNIGKVFDKLTFPVLGSSIIAGVNFVSSYVQNSNRLFLNHFGEEAGLERKVKRMLWLTDTFTDKNGIAVSLNTYRNEIIGRNLPIDFLVCHETLEPGDNLIVTRPIGSFPIPMYREQNIRIPNIMEVHRIFKEGNYDRIICSTEFFMGAVGLYLKKCFNVKAFFFMHTDWLEFSNKALELSEDIKKRLKRFSRQFYRSFDRLFVLNRDHKEWLSGKRMNIPEERISVTKHWVGSNFRPSESPVARERIILYVGRLSEEKGLFDFPYIFERIKESFPEARAVLVGTGPIKDKLKKEMPEAEFIEWVDQSSLPEIYSKSDFLVFPSMFDTFGRVVLESISCGCPVAAYNVKGPKDIIEHGRSGVLAMNKFDLAEEICNVMKSEENYLNMRKQAVERSGDFFCDAILDNLLINCELAEELDKIVINN